MVLVLNTIHHPINVSYSSCSTGPKLLCWNYSLCKVGWRTCESLIPTGEIISIWLKLHVPKILIFSDFAPEGYTWPCIDPSSDNLLSWSIYIFNLICRCRNNSVQNKLRSSDCLKKCEPSKHVTPYISVTLQRE